VGLWKTLKIRAHTPNKLFGAEGKRRKAIAYCEEVNVFSHLDGIMLDTIFVCSGGASYGADKSGRFNHLGHNFWNRGHSQFSFEPVHSYFHVEEHSRESKKVVEGGQNAK